MTKKCISIYFHVFTASLFIYTFCFIVYLLYVESSFACVELSLWLISTNNDNARRSTDSLCSSWYLNDRHVYKGDLNVYRNYKAMIKTIRKACPSSRHSSWFKWPHVTLESCLNPIVFFECLYVIVKAESLGCMHTCTVLNVDI